MEFVEKRKRKIQKAPIGPDPNAAIDQALFQLLLGCALTPIFITGMAIFLNWDCYYFILEEYLPDPHYRGTTTILVALALRTVVVFLCAAEMSRLLAFAVISTVICYTSAKGMLQYLTLHVHEIRHFIKWYSYLYMVLYIMNRVIANISFILASTAFFLTIELLFVCTVSYNRNSTLVFVLFCLSAGAVIVMTYFGFYFNVEIASNTKVLLERKRKESYISWCGNKTRGKLIDRLILRSLRSFEFWYGTFFPINDDMFVAYWLNLMDGWMTTALAINL